MPRRRIWIEPDGSFAIEFPYSKPILEQVRLIPGRKWDGNLRLWRAPQSSAPQLKAFLHGRNDFEVAPEVAAVLDTVERGTEYHVFVNEDAKLLVLRCGYMADVVDAVKRVSGAQWHKLPLGYWTVPAREADTFRADLVDRFSLAVHPAARPILQAWGEEAERLRHLSRAAEAELVVDGIAPGLDLLPYQKAGVRYASAAGWRTFISDEPGLGKTVQGIAAAQMFGRWPVVVVCPTVVETHWRREILRFFPGRTVRVLKGQKPYPLTGEFEATPDFLIVGYPVVAYWLDALMACNPQGLILDESHMLKSGKAQRTRAVKALAGVGTQEVKASALVGAVPGDGMVLCLTGTPLLNTTTELIQQLSIMGRLMDFGGWARFNSRYVKLGHLDDDAIKERRRELNEHLRAVCMVRRRKSDVLKELPQKRRAFVWVEPDPAVMREYRKAEADVLSFLADRARGVAAELGLDADDEAVMARMRASGAETLVRINILRQLAAKSKLTAAREWALTFAESGESLIVFAHHSVIVDDLARALSAGVIAGGMPGQSRQEVIDDFQAKRTQTVVLSIMAAGVGITLTAASNELFVEQAWNPGTLTQAEDRAHRIGQEESLTAFYLLAEGTIDADMMELIEAKRSEVDNVADGADVENWTEGDPEDALRVKGSVAAEMIERLTRRALGTDGESSKATSSDPVDDTLALFA